MSQQSEPSSQPHCSGFRAMEAARNVAHGYCQGNVLGYRMHWRAACRQVEISKTRGSDVSALTHLRRASTE